MRRICQEMEGNLQRELGSKGFVCQVHMPYPVTMPPAPPSCVFPFPSNHRQTVMNISLHLSLNPAFLPTTASLPNPLLQTHHSPPPSKSPTPTHKTPLLSKQHPTHLSSPPPLSTNPHPLPTPTHLPPFPRLSQPLPHQLQQAKHLIKRSTHLPPQLPLSPAWNRSQAPEGGTGM